MSLSMNDNCPTIFAILSGMIAEILKYFNSRGGEARVRPLTIQQKPLGWKGMDVLHLYAISNSNL